jgi:DNA-binding NarL/FixJ family response regulator
MSMAAGVRIVIFADDPQRSGPLSVGLRMHEGFEILGEGSSLRDAIQLLRVSPPDIVILMAVSPLRSWMRFAKLVLGRRPDLGILWIEQPDDFVKAAVQTGTPGVLVREGADLAAAIRMELEARRVSGGSGDWRQAS